MATYFVRPVNGDIDTAWTIDTIARVDDVVTVTTVADHDVVNGDDVTIAVATASFNGTFTATKTGDKTFTYAQVDDDDDDAGGTATRLCRVDGKAFADAFKTTQQAADVAVGGDEVRLCAEATETPAATVDFDTNAGDAKPIRFRGASGVDGSLDGSVYTLSGSALGAATDLVNLAVANLHARFFDIRFTAATRHNIHIANVAYALLFRRCRIDNAGSNGVNSDRDRFSAGSIIWVGCEVDNNGGGGLTQTTTGKKTFTLLIGNSIHHNTGVGVGNAESTGGQSAKLNTIYRNGSHGMTITYGIQTITIGMREHEISGNVFFDNAGDGLRVVQDGFWGAIYNNIFRSNDGYGINKQTGSADDFFFCDYNCYHNNTSGHIDIDAGVPPGSNNVTADPKFTSEVDGAEDFSLQSDSPCIDAGFDGPTA